MSSVRCFLWPCSHLISMTCLKPKISERRLDCSVFFKCSLNCVNMDIKLSCKSVCTDTSIGSSSFYPKQTTNLRICPPVSFMHALHEYCNAKQKQPRVRILQSQRFDLLFSTTRLFPHTIIKWVLPPLPLNVYSFEYYFWCWKQRRKKKLILEQYTKKNCQEKTTEKQVKDSKCLVNLTLLLY